MSYLFLFGPRSLKQCYLPWRSFRFYCVALDQHSMAELKFRKIKFQQEGLFVKKSVRFFTLKAF